MRPNVRTALSITLGAVVAVVLAGVIAFQVSPWPGVLVIRGSGSDGLDTADASAQYVPDDIAEQLDQHYAPGSPDHRLDVFRPGPPNHSRRSSGSTAAPSLPGSRRRCGRT